MPCPGRLRWRPGPVDALAQGFQNPPDSAKPRTWWHWTNGNVTKDGITKDLEWMNRVGIGGLQLADVAAGRRPDGRAEDPLRHPEWFDAVRHAAGGGGPAGAGDGDFQFGRLERDRRTVGQAGAGDEEARLERDRRVHGPQVVQRQAPAAAFEQRAVRNSRPAAAGRRRAAAIPLTTATARCSPIRTPADESAMADAASEGDRQQRRRSMARR